MTGRDLSGNELLAQLAGMVALVAAPASEQETWALTEDVPAEEIALQLYDSVPGWFDRLRDEGLIRPEAERALVQLVTLLDDRQALLFRDGPYVTNDPAWTGVRDTANAALLALQS